MKISIITPTKNSAKTLEETLKSIASQTHKDIEHIVIDGGSTDDTMNIVNRYRQNISVVVSEDDNGIYDAMNKGIRLATGKYVAFLNSDDYYHSNTGIEDSILSLEKTEADSSYAPVRIVDKNGKTIRYFHPHTTPKIKTIFFNMSFSHQTMITKRDVLIKEGGFDMNLKSAADYDLIIRLCLNGYRSVFVNKI